MSLLSKFATVNRSRLSSCLWNGNRHSNSGITINFKKRFISTSHVVETTQKESKAVQYWLFGVSGLVACMVTVGGITRLTRSGLSMTDWKLQGKLPPSTKEQWESEFENYKKFPEWQQRQNMTLEEFKYIFFWEYGHRMMGRFIGFAYTVPLIYFFSRNMIPRHLYSRVGMLFGLGGAQGLVGWWMVKSGLDIDPNQKKEIRVSPYRLATHLAMAFTTYTLLIWTGLDLVNPMSKAKLIAESMQPEILKTARRMRKLACLNGALVATTVLSGAYVAGNDAGRAYNTFPKMGDDWIPSGILSMEPLWKNFFENTATVQFDHRVLALSTVGTVSAMYAYAVRSGNGIFWKSLPKYTQYAFNACLGMTATQVGLGISTLLLYVPVPLAAVHQAGSLVLLTCITCLAHSLRFSAAPLQGIASKVAGSIATKAKHISSSIK